MIFQKEQSTSREIIRSSTDRPEWKASLPVDFRVKQWQLTYCSRWLRSRHFSVVAKNSRNLTRRSFSNVWHRAKTFSRAEREQKNIDDDHRDLLNNRISTSFMSSMYLGLARLSSWRASPYFPFAVSFSFRHRSTFSVTLTRWNPRKEALRWSEEKYNVRHSLDPVAQRRPISSCSPVFRPSWGSSSRRDIRACTCRV